MNDQSVNNEVIPQVQLIKCKRCKSESSPDEYQLKANGTHYAFCNTCRALLSKKALEKNNEKQVSAPIQTHQAPIQTQQAPIQYQQAPIQYQQPVIKERPKIAPVLERPIKESKPRQLSIPTHDMKSHIKETINEMIEEKKKQKQSFNNMPTLKALEPVVKIDKKVEQSEVSENSGLLEKVIYGVGGLAVGLLLLSNNSQSNNSLYSVYK